jgi:uroporphyrinogen III methyltransferase/synthase
MSDVQPAGLVVLVGAGPGSPGLITVEGVRWLRQARVVIYDRLAGSGLLEYAPQAQHIYVGKHHGHSAATQDYINKLIVEQARRGGVVVRLKGGDPLLFARAGDEIDAMNAASVAFRIVPGVTAAMAGAAYAGIPLTDRRCASSVVLATGRKQDAGDEVDYAALAGADTIVLYMGVGNLPSIAGGLISAGKPPSTPAAVVCDASLPTQRTVEGTLADIADRAAREGVSPPALLIVGEVVRYRQHMNWFDSLPLRGAAVLVTRSLAQASRLAQELESLGARAIEAPAIEIVPPETYEPLDRALADARQFDWIVITSPSAVEVVFERLAAMGRDARALGGAKVAAVGKVTAQELSLHGVRADLVPQSFTTAELGGAMLAREKLRGVKVLLARGELASKDVVGMLKQAGAVVSEACTYRTVMPPSLPPEAIEALRGGMVDWVTFASSSAVDNLLALVEQAGVSLGRARLAAIGPATAQALRRRGLLCDVVAAQHTIDGLVAALVEAHRRQG